MFEQAQASYDPNAVAAVLHQFPYHVDSLLAMNELYRSLGEAQVSRMLCTGIMLFLQVSMLDVKAAIHHELMKHIGQQKQVIPAPTVKGVRMVTVLSL